MSAIGVLLVAFLLLLLVAVVLALIWAAPAGREDQAGFHLDTPEPPAPPTAVEAKDVKECVSPVVAKV